MTRRALTTALLALCAVSTAALAQEAPPRRGQPEKPTYWGGYEGFGRFGNDHGRRGFGADQTFRGQGASWSNRDTTVASGTIGLGYGLAMGPYQGSFTESWGYPDGGGRSVPAIPSAPQPGSAW